MELSLCTLSSDHSWPAFNTRKALFPEASFVICWPHISREVRVAVINLVGRTRDVAQESIPSLPYK